MVRHTLGHFRILEKIGAGGMGEVYRAHDEHLSRDVAVKVLPTGTLGDEDARRRFRKEALALSRLNHPNIATVHDFDTQDGVDFLVMEYIAGVTLNELLKQGPLPERQILDLGIQLAEGLVSAHKEGIVHQDIKPGNLRLTPEGRLKILDFGLAKLAPLVSGARTESVVGTQPIAGTLSYMAPEQLLGSTIDGRTDIYAAGVVLYEMSTGQHPFKVALVAVLTDAILHRTPAPPNRLNTAVSPGLGDIILRCLKKEPEGRCQSAKELRADLELLRREPTSETGSRSRTKTRLRRRTRGIQIRSLAVIPLENLMKDPEQEYFVDGMTEALIAGLARIGVLRVISRTSTMHYKGTRKALPEIARELNVDGLVEGSVLRAGDHVRITARLIEGATDHALWAESYERDLQDTLVLQTVVAEAIAREILIKLTPQDRRRMRHRRSVPHEIYDIYLRGRYQWNKRTRDGVMQGIVCFEEAIDKDPTYALAHAALADSYFVQGVDEYADGPPKETMAKARAAAQKALQLDDTLAEAHTTLASVRWVFDWDWAAAEEGFKHALKLNSSYATAHHWYSLFLGAMGRHGEAIAQIKQAHDLDPLSPIISENVGYCYFRARQYDAAIEWLVELIRLEPNFWPAHSVLGVAYVQKGMFDKAIVELEKAASFAGGLTMLKALLGNTYALGGNTAKALELLEELTRLSERRYVSPAHIACVYAGLGDKDQVFTWLDKAYEDRSDYLPQIKALPYFDPFRQDPRFESLISRIGLPR